MAVCCHGAQKRAGETQSYDGLCFTHTSTLLLRVQANKGFERRREIENKHKKRSTQKPCLRLSLSSFFSCFLSLPGMNAAVRAVVRMGLYVGAKVYFIHEVRRSSAMHSFQGFTPHEPVYYTCVIAGKVATDGRFVEYSETI